MVINTQTQNTYAFPVDSSIYRLFLKPSSFMVCLSKPFYNRHKQLSYPVKAISFNRPLSMDLNCLCLDAHNRNIVLKFLFVFQKMKPFDLNFELNLVSNLGHQFIFCNEKGRMDGRFY